MQSPFKPWLSPDLATSSASDDDAFGRSTPLSAEAAELHRVRTQARRLRNATKGTQFEVQLEDLLYRMDYALHDAESGLQPQTDTQEFQTELDYLRRGLNGKDRPVMDEYDVRIDLDHGPTRDYITKLLTTELQSLESYEGGRWLASAMLKQLDASNELNLTQSVRSAGMRLKSTAQMRKDVAARMAAGEYDTDYVSYFSQACPQEESWPHDVNGDAWQVDHVLELWQGGADDASNFLPIDKALHAAKNDIMKRFRTSVRDAHKIDGFQVELVTDLTGELVSNEGPSDRR